MSDWGGAQQLKLVYTLIIHVQVSLNSCEAMWSASNLQGPRHHLSRRQYGEESKTTQELHRLDVTHRDAAGDAVLRLAPEIHRWIRPASLKQRTVSFCFTNKEQTKNHAPQKPKNPETRSRLNERAF